MKKKSSTVVDLPQNHPSVSDTAQPCPYLTGFPGYGELNSRRIQGPANNGNVPRALFYSTLLSVIAVALIIPSLPKVTESLGGGAVHIGLVGTLYGISQLLGSNFLGSWSDTRGRRVVLQLSFLGGAIGYFMIYVAMWKESLTLLLISRIPVGIFMQTMTMARSIVSDCSDASSRARALATNVGVPAGLGFIVGPMMGGILSSRAPLVPPLLATFLFCLAFGISYVFIPETAPMKRMSTCRLEGSHSFAIRSFLLVSLFFFLTSSPLFICPHTHTHLHTYTHPLFTGMKEDNASSRTPNKEKKIERKGLISMISTLLYHHVFASKLFIARSVVMLAYLIMQSSFHVFAYRQMNLETRSIGLVLTYCGIVSVCVDFFVIPYFHKHFGNRMSSHEEQLLVTMSAFCLCIALIAMAMSTAMPSFLISIIPLASSSTLFKRNVMSLLTKCVPAEEVGTITGLANALDSVCRILAPVLAGTLMEYSGASSALYFGAFLSALGGFSFHLISKRADALNTTKMKKEA